MFITRSLERSIFNVKRIKWATVAKVYLGTHTICYYYPFYPLLIHFPEPLVTVVNWVKCITL